MKKYTRAESDATPIKKEEVEDAVKLNVESKQAALKKLLDKKHQ